MSADLSVALDRCCAFLEVHALDDRIFSVLFLYGDKSFLDLFLARKCGSFLFLALCDVFYVIKKRQLLADRSARSLAFGYDLVCNDRDPSDEQILVDNAVVQLGHGIHYRVRRGCLFLEIFSTVRVLGYLPALSVNNDLACVF